MFAKPGLAPVAMSPWSRQRRGSEGKGPAEELAGALRTREFSGFNTGEDVKALLRLLCLQMGDWDEREGQPWL